MNAVLFKVYQKYDVVDKAYNAANNRPEDATTEVYRFLFGTLDKEQAVNACSNADGRLIFTSDQAYYAIENG